uniref:Uncharacterized protein n=1 Tax=Panagrolaimus sp. ES5 TaxID=591445 RepID=A0AC34GYA3_9BILA
MLAFACMGDYARIRADQEAFEQQQMAVMAMNQGMMNASTGTGGMPFSTNPTMTSSTGQSFSDAARKFVVSSTAPREEEDYDT